MHVCVCVCVHFMYVTRYVRDHIMIIYSIMCMYVCTAGSEYVRVCACVYMCTSSANISVCIIFIIINIICVDTCVYNVYVCTCVCACVCVCLKIYTCVCPSTYLLNFSGCYICFWFRQ